jgi:hypothetical protein
MMDSSTKLIIINAYDSFGSEDCAPTWIKLYNILILYNIVY